MKTITHNQHLKEECETLRKGSPSSLSSLQPSGLFSSAAQVSQTESKSSENSLRKSFWKGSNLTTALIGPVVSVLQNKLEALSRKMTWRKVLGMFLAGPLAFGSDLVYSLFKLETKISGWYYDNFRYLFMCLGPYLMACFIALGFYFYYSPVNHKNSWGGCLPLSIPIAKMMWMIRVTNDVEWHQVPPYTYFGGAALIVITFWFVGDDLMYIYNHRIRNAASTMDNITNNRKALPAEDVVDMYAKTWAKLRSI
jgi:hypothetical protein